MTKENGGLMETKEIIAIALFAAMYILLLVLKQKFRPFVALGFAAVYVIFGFLPIGKVFSSVDWNVILMISGTMGAVWLFIESKMPARLADIIIAKTPNVMWAIVALSVFAGIVSAFVDNTSTVLMVAPVAITIAKKLKTSPVPFIIPIAISSNLQGAATLVGDTTSIMLGGYANMSFTDFFVYNGKVGLFFVVEAGAVIATLILIITLRKYKQPVESKDYTEVNDYFPTFLLIGIVVLLICASFVKNKPDITNGIICMAMFIIGITRLAIKKKNAGLYLEGIKQIDFKTIGLLIGIFIVIGSLTHAGVINDIGNLFSRASDNLFVIYTIIVWASVLFSAFIDNIPYVATMLPVVQTIAGNLGADPTVLYFGLLIGATLGGNITPVGASANIAGLGILKKEGYDVSTGTFMKISVPFTLAAVISGYILIWVIYR